MLNLTLYYYQHITNRCSASSTYYITPYNCVVSTSLHTWYYLIIATRLLNSVIIILLHVCVFDICGRRGCCFTSGTSPSFCTNHEY